MKVPIPFVGGGYQGYSVNVDAQRCINWYPVVDQEGGKVPLYLRGTPGLVEWCDLGEDREVKQLHKMGIYLYAVCGTNVYVITRAGSATKLGNIGGMVDDPISMTNNRAEVLIVNGRSGWIANSTALTEISDADLPRPSMCDFQDGYFIVLEKGTQAFYISASYDGTSWDALDFASAEARPDDAKALISVQRELIIPGDRTTEVFYNSGDSEYPFERVQGAFIEQGIGAIASLCRGDNTAFWLDNHGMVRRLEGYNPIVISPSTVNHQIQNYSDFSDARSFVYSQAGHTFLVITFPTGDTTWVYDILTGLWHERQSFKLHPTTGDRLAQDGRWRANCYEFFNGKHLVGDYENGKIYELDLDTYTDDSEEIKRTRTTQHIHQNRQELFWNNVEIEMESGTGLVTGQGSDPQMMLQWSDDGGHTWSNEYWRDFGQIGEYYYRSQWRRIGKSRDRVFRLMISDPVKCVLLGAYADIEAGID